MSDPVRPGATDRLLDLIDAPRPARFQWRVVLVAGTGFFADSYDLFVVGLVAALVTPEWHLSTGQISLLDSVSLASSAAGAAVFGRIADLIGRKRVYGYELLLLSVAALVSAFSPGYTFLLVCRIVLGFGIGGDYPVSATIMSEYSSRRSRGAMVGLVFAMQGAGLVVGPLVASLLLALGISHDVSWRILLALGAAPGLAIFPIRRRIRETPRFSLASGAPEEAAAAIAQVTGGRANIPHAPRLVHPLRHPQRMLAGLLTLGRSHRMRVWLFATAASWCLLDFAYYGNTISTPEILRLLDPGASLLRHTLTQLVIFAVFALPGYALAVLLLDRAGRKPMQLIGFLAMGAAFALIGALPGATAEVAPFVALYGASYLFAELGPNTTTFVYPAEIFPVEVRTSADGISAAAGKMGAFAGVFLFPDMLASSWGIRGAEIVAAAVSVAGAAFTLALPEPRGRSLEELEMAAHDEPVHAAVQP